MQEILGLNHHTHDTIDHDVQRGRADDDIKINGQYLKEGTGKPRCDELKTNSMLKLKTFRIQYTSLRPANCCKILKTRDTLRYRHRLSML